MATLHCWRKELWPTFNAMAPVTSGQGLRSGSIFPTGHVALGASLVKTNQETMSSNSAQLGDLDESLSLNPRKEALISQACQENCSSRNQH